MTKEELKQQVCVAIDKRHDDILALGQSIWEEPELGYKEQKTSAKVQDQFSKLNIPYTTGWGITGVKGLLKGRKSNRTVAMLGELDAIVCRNHPAAEAGTGAAHCCGHNVQISNLVAVAMGLQESGAMNYLDGNVVLFAVPAEEYVEIDYRDKLRAAGKIKYLGGKAEIIAQGGFDEVDMAVQMHVSATDNRHGDFRYGGTCNGFIGKLVEYKGKAAHAAGAPDQGINALNAAIMGIMGVNAIRETFKEADCVRFHPIITSGGDLVNVIPDRVTMESYVRASSIKALQHYNKTVNRALRAGADAIGATVEIRDLPGYLPMVRHEKMNDILRDNAVVLFGEENVISGQHSAGSTDMGDLCHLMPVVHPWVGCVTGVLHGEDYELADETTAYFKTSKVLAMTIIDLLYDDAQGAEDVLANDKPVLTKTEYLDYMESIK